MPATLPNPPPFRSEEALKLNPGDLRALEAIRGTYLAQNQPIQAVQKVKEYAGNAPKSAPIQIGRGPEAKPRRPARTRSHQGNLSRSESTNSGRPESQRVCRQRSQIRPH